MSIEWMRLTVSILSSVMSALSSLKVLQLWSAVSPYLSVPVWPWLAVPLRHLLAPESQSGHRLRSMFPSP